MNCVHCNEPLLERERDPNRPIDAHPECIFRMISGSAAHLLGECSCFGGTREDPPAMSKRESAKLALDTYLTLQGGKA